MDGVGVGNRSVVGGLKLSFFASSGLTFTLTAWCIGSSLYFGTPPINPSNPVFPKWFGFQASSWTFLVFRLGMRLECGGIIR